MDRRSFLAFAAGGAALGSARAARRERRAGRNGLRLSITWGMLGRMPVREALALLERHGFDAYEMFDWRDPALLASFVAERKNHELACATLVANRGVTAPGCGLVNPRERESFLEQVGLAIEAARQAECQRLVVLTGNELGGMLRSEQMSNAVGALRAAAPLVERSGMTAVVEVLNTYVNHAGYFLYYVRDAAVLIDRVASSSVKILFDIYHVQIMEGNLIENIRANVDRIGHFHIGDVPGRHEPGTGEINYRNVFKAIYELGDRFQGSAALEYNPIAPLEEDLASMRQMTTFA